MIRYILLSAVVLAVFAVEGQAQHVPCCLPERWVGIVHQSLRFTRKDVPTIGFRNAYLEYAYDYPNRRLAARIYNDYTGGYERYVLAFNQDRAIFIKNGECTYTTLHARDFKRQCISEHASYQGSFSMGLGQLTYDRWYIFSEEVHAIVDTSQDNCVPGFVFEHFSNDLVSTHVDRKYVNVTAEISDETIFDQPSDCVEKPDLNFFDTNDEGINKMHAYFVTPTLLSRPEKQKSTYDKIPSF